MKKKKSRTLLILSCFVIISSGCSLPSLSNVKQEKAEVNSKEKQQSKYDQLAKNKNKEIELQPIELTSYSEKVGANITKPEYKEFAVNHEFTLSGAVTDSSLLTSDYVWVKVSSLDHIDSSTIQEYYIPIKDNQFTKKIHFYNGDGRYSVQVLLPATDKENYYYDLARFVVINVNPKKQRDLTYTPYALEAGLTLKDLDSGLLTASELIPLHGKVESVSSNQHVMVEVVKDMDHWKHVIPLKNGEFSYNVPLFFGKGVHRINVLVPDQTTDDRYQFGTTLFVDNQSARTMTPIEYYKTYEERGVTLETPQYGGDDTNLTYRIKGQIDPNAPQAAETTHIYVKTKKDNDEALDVIPVKDFQFDGSVLLRFGPGEYDVSVNVPEIKNENTNYFRYFSVASFPVENTADKDQRDLLPSKGIQSDDSKIIKLANELTKDKKTKKAKAKAIYEYTAKHVSYDVTKFKNNEFKWDDSALKTLETKTGVCQDYAYLAIALLRASHIEARFVSGKAGTGFLKDNHAWVEVKINGDWLIMDPTWGAGYVKDDKFVAKYTEQYFDPDATEFSKTHIRGKIEY